MRRSSNGSSKPYQPLPTRRASFNGGFDADLNVLLQNDTIFLEQQQAQTSTKKSPRKILNNTILPPSPTQKLQSLSSSIQVNPTPLTLTTPPTIGTNNNNNTATITSAQDQQHANLPSNLYKTELCRSFEETGTCRYGSKCQFAHGYPELRPAPRHPKYKTEICKTFHSIGTCPYGTRCRFIHTSPSDNIDWITSDVDNPLFDLHAKNAPEFDRSPNTIPPVATYQSFIARLPPTPHRYQSQVGYSSQINNNEPFLSVIRAEIPPRLEPTPRIESRTLTVERPSTNLTNSSHAVSIAVAPTSAINSNNIPSSSTGSNSSSSNMNLAALTAAVAAITSPVQVQAPAPAPAQAALPPVVSTTIGTSNITVPTPISTANNVANAVNTHKLSPPVVSVGNTASITSNITSNSTSISATTLLPSSHKHRLPVFRELCHQNSVERLQQQVLDFVFEKEQ